ncbi:MAG: hypothetical protein ABIU05_11110, partial [Nitrospirales bacterium]
MSVFLHHLIAVTTSLILALPPGSCSVSVQHDRGDSAPVKKAPCCHDEAPASPCESGNSPAKPSVKCCCVRDAALPEKSVQPTDNLYLAFAVVADHVLLDIESLVGGAKGLAPVRSGTRLQILLCVWR